MFPIIELGDTGHDVRVIQSIYAAMACRDPEVLFEVKAALGAWGDGHGVDGIYGNGGKRATRWIQRHLGMPTTGVVDARLTDYLVALGYNLADDDQHLACVNGEPDVPAPPTPPVTPPTPPIFDSTGEVLTDGTHQKIVVVNDSPLPTSTAREWTDAWQAQVYEDIAQHWGYADVTFKPKDDEKEIELLIREKTDGPYGGWHAYDGRHPFGVVFLDSGNPSGVGSHEVIEIITNQTIDHVSEVHTQFGIEHWALEGADAVQRDFYDKRGVSVSDFLTKHYFGEHGGDPLDYSHLGSVDRPYGIADGGYAIVRNVSGVIEFRFADARTASFASSGAPVEKDPHTGLYICSAEDFCHADRHPLIARHRRVIGKLIATGEITMPASQEEE